MSTTRKADPALLAKYFPSELKGKLTTADKIPRPAPKPPTPETVADPLAKEKLRWTRELRYALELFAPYALYVASSEGPVSITLYHPDGSVRRRIGHNRGVWPVKVDKSSAARPWHDKTSYNLARGPFDFRVKVRTWLWLASFEDAAELSSHAGAILAAAAEQAGFDELEDGYIDGGADFLLVNFSREILMLARRGMAAWEGMSAMPPMLVWTNETLHEFMTRALSASQQKDIQIMDDQGHKIGGGMAQAFIKVCDRMLERERERQFPGRSRCNF